MKQRNYHFALHVSAAVCGLVCFAQNEAYAADPMPYKCDFKLDEATGQEYFRCCWNKPTEPEDCRDMYRAPTPAPGPTPAPTPAPAPGPVPVAPPVAAPAPMATECLTSITKTAEYSGTSGFSYLTNDSMLALQGLLVTQSTIGHLECGKDVNGKNIPCTNNQIGAVTKHCVMAGYDPPPLLQPDVGFNQAFADPSFGAYALLPWVKLPSAGTSAIYKGAGNTILAGNCMPPYVIENGAVVRKNDAGTNSPQLCDRKVTQNAPPDVRTSPTPTPCPTAFPGASAQCPGPYPDPDEPAVPDCSADAPTGPVKNLGDGCSVIPTTGGYTTPFSYCHKDIGNIPLACGPDKPAIAGPPCPGVPTPGSYILPGFKCGGAIPLLGTAPIDDPMTAEEACPPSDWCIDPARSTKFRDGNIHINDGADPGKYNITLAIGANNLNVGNSIRVALIPGMGACAGGAKGQLALSQGYIYAIMPASIQAKPGGPPVATCYGQGCNYGVGDPSTWDAAPYAIDYLTPYQPFGAFTVPPVEHYESPSADIPYLDLPPGTQVYFSLRAKGRMTLPKGGTVVTPTGGLLAFPANGWIEAWGDGTTVRLSEGTGYMLDASRPPITPANPTPATGVHMNVANGNCYVEIIPPVDTSQLGNPTPTTPITQSTYCTGGPRPTSVANLIPNAAIMVTTNAIAIPGGTKLPPFTRMEQVSQCGLTTMTGAAVEPNYCSEGKVFDSTTQSCVDATPDCGGDSFTPWTGTLPPPPGQGGTCGAASTATWAGDCYTVTEAGTCAPTICPTGTTVKQPVKCNTPGFIWCHDTQKCVQQDPLSANQEAMCAMAPDPAECRLNYSALQNTGQAQCNNDSTSLQCPPEYEKANTHDFRGLDTCSVPADTLVCVKLLP